MADNTINRTRPPKGDDSIDDVLEAYPEAETGTPSKPKAKDVDDGARVGKNVRMRPTYGQWLFKLATERTMEGSRKVHEADILDEALTEYFRKRGLVK